MNTTELSNHYELHLARQRELEAAAQDYRLSAMVGKKKKNSTARKYVGGKLISLGQKLAQGHIQDAQLSFSTKE